VTAFWLIYARDLLTLLVTVAYCWKVNRDFKSNFYFSQNESADPGLISNFSELLDSTIPQTLFFRYVYSE
jgi:hypothetical protein